MDPLGQLYILCTIVGWGFIIACFAMGQIDHGHGMHADMDGGHGIGAGHGVGGHAGLHGHGGHLGIHDAGGHGGHAGHAGGHANGSGHGGNGHGGHGQAHEGSEEAHTSVNPVVRARENKLYFTLMGILSPMSMSLFTGFFGSVGFITWHYAPALGYFTLIPAIGVATVATEVLKRAMSQIVSKLSASSLTKRGEAIGRIAQVNIPITGERLGEVTYVIGTTRFNSSAKSAKPGETFQRGSKVMIVETDGPVVFVEPVNDLDLEML
ncbi:MAG: NfeD family protein [Cyanobacteria bacterium SZAS TMP-1]|nr:NfeD family protein [Cyanobacteria bacterium SZAS TMP-1]